MVQQHIPSYITQYFWGDDLNDLDIHKNQKYIIQTILEKGDQIAIKWLFATFDILTIKKELPSLRLSKKSSHFWNIYLS